MTSKFVTFLCPIRQFSHFRRFFDNSQRNMQRNFGSREWSKDFANDLELCVAELLWQQRNAGMPEVKIIM